MTFDPMQQTEKIIVLIGLMGAGKTSVGRKLAKLINMDFVDVDEEITKAAGCSVEDIFFKYGEDAFRDVEERVMARLLGEKTRVLATGGGAFINKNIRTSIKEHGVSVWLNADLETLWKRVKHKRSRPLLRTENPRETLANIYKDRVKTYCLADIIIESRDKSSLEEMANLVIKSLLDRNDLIESA